MKYAGLQEKLDHCLPLMGILHKNNFIKLMFSNNILQNNSFAPNILSQSYIATKLIPQFNFKSKKLSFKSTEISLQFSWAITNWNPQ